MSYLAWRPYVPVAEKRRRAERKLAKLRKKGQSVAPITIEGRTIAKSFWGQSWCTNLEHYSDYENRLPRGRTYVRNGSVLDLHIAKGEVAAMVAGSELYKIKIAIAPVTRARWKSICRDCAGTVNSLVELLQGRAIATYPTAVGARSLPPSLACSAGSSVNAASRAIRVRVCTGPRGRRRAIAS